MNNGVYVLQTYGPEYRVVYAENIDGIYGEYDDNTFHWNGDDEMLKEYFEESQVYEDLYLAWDYAISLSENHKYLEDGICLIKDFDERKFSDI